MKNISHKTLKLALVVLAVSASSVSATPPSLIQLASNTGNFCSCNGQTTTINLSTFNATGWTVNEVENCVNVGAPCPWQYYGSPKLWQGSYIIPANQCLTGTVIWELYTVTALPNCQGGSANPGCREEQYPYTLRYKINGQLTPCD